MSTSPRRRVLCSTARQDAGTIRKRLQRLDKAALNRIEEQYVAAATTSIATTGRALPVMRDAYRLLRQFIDELHLK